MPIETNRAVNLTGPVRDVPRRMVLLRVLDIPTSPSWSENDPSSRPPPLPAPSRRIETRRIEINRGLRLPVLDRAEFRARSVAVWFVHLATSHPATTDQKIGKLTMAALPPFRPSIRSFRTPRL